MKIRETDLNKIMLTLDNIKNIFVVCILNNFLYIPIVALFMTIMKGQQGSSLAQFKIST